LDNRFYVAKTRIVISSSLEQNADTYSPENGVPARGGMGSAAALSSLASPPFLRTENILEPLYPREFLLYEHREVGQKSDNSGQTLIALDFRAA
jgi:hypothetical protein